MTPGRISRAIRRASVLSGSGPGLNPPTHDPTIAPMIPSTNAPNTTAATRVPLLGLVNVNVAFLDAGQNRRV
ncbi:hypothetical protein Are01nite_51800 [Actinoplanes regularis]|nr:hypothetical protein Are01nite_51800 [Actinoplanes regularis]